MSVDGLYFRWDDHGKLVTYGIDLPDAQFIAYGDLPEDIHQYTLAKFVWNGSAIVVRDGWVDPVIEPEAPTEPETPADPE